MSKLNLVPSVTRLYDLARFHRVEEFEAVGEGYFATLYVSVEGDGNPEWGMPVITTVHVAAEQWRDGMDDDGDGEPVTTPEGLAALLGCEPAEVAGHLHERVLDRWCDQWERHNER